MLILIQNNAICYQEVYLQFLSNMSAKLFHSPSLCKSYQMKK